MGQIENTGLLILIVFLIGISFYFVELYHEKIHLSDSFIAGVSISYFFLIVLPEISENLPEFPLHLTAFEYYFVLLGFVFNHLSEKFILQRVEPKTQNKARNLVRMERDLELVEKSLEIMIADELHLENHNEESLRDLTGSLISLRNQEKNILAEIEKEEKKIHDHIGTYLNDLRRIISFVYHFLIGFIMIGLIQVEIVEVLFFFIFALFNTLVTSRYKRRSIFSDLDIEVKFEDKGFKKISLSLATIFGIIIGFFLDFIFPLNLEILYLLFSFISGVILYTITRYIIPEKEKGRPWLFLFSFLGFSVLVLSLKIFLHLDLW
ncbi:MAG: hypothetical protein ACTSWX_01355 [Promethearchaeota archaeon]